MAAVRLCSRVLLVFPCWSLESLPPALLFHQTVAMSLPSLVPSMALVFAQAHSHRVNFFNLGSAISPFCPLFIMSERASNFRGFVLNVCRTMPSLTGFHQAICTSKVTYYCAEM